MISKKLMPDGGPGGKAVPYFDFDLAHPYLRKHLIAYIGNKRALHGFLYQAFRSLFPEPGAVFLDPFAGSGAVSRLARFMGFQVLANDWEFYAYVLNRAHLGIGREKAAQLYVQAGGLEAVFQNLNNLPDPPAGQQYIARHYAPKNTAAADYRRERLFYTRENALRIDALRGAMEELYPGFELIEPQQGEKMLLLASLLYQCATHTNTSGVFKACHKGFGGHGRDALGRIKAPIRLQIPELIDSPYRAEAYCREAAEFVGSHSGDLCYLDPPYNQHQYGSNYHLLNTIARWDKPPVSNALTPDGVLKHKAAIRTDWVKTKSPYCYRSSATEAFQGLLQAIDARYILLSYNTEGLIPFETLIELMSRQGELRLFVNDYVKYRGGKQSIRRQVHNLEFLLVLDRSKRNSSGDQAEIERLVALRRARLLLRRSFHPQRIVKSFPTEGESILLPRASGRVDRGPPDCETPGCGPPGCGPPAREAPDRGPPARLIMPRWYRFHPFVDRAALALSRLNTAELEDFCTRLAACECQNKQEEIGILVDLLKAGAVTGDADAAEVTGGTNTGDANAAEVAGSTNTGDAGAVTTAGAANAVDAEAATEANHYRERVLWLLKKFAHRKYRATFEQTLDRLRNLAREYPGRFGALNPGLEEIERLARARFNG